MLWQHNQFGILKTKNKKKLPSVSNILVNLGCLNRKSFLCARKPKSHVLKATPSWLFQNSGKNYGTLCTSPRCCQLATEKPCLISFTDILTRNSLGADLVLLHPWHICPSNRQEDLWSYQKGQQNFDQKPIIACRKWINESLLSKLISCPWSLINNHETFSVYVHSDTLVLSFCCILHLRT